MEQLRRVGQYQCSQTLLGRGVSSHVYKGVDTSTGLPIVFKVTNSAKITKGARQMLLKNQIKALQILDHPYVLSTYTIAKTSKEILMIIEFCQCGDLMKYILKHGAFSENQSLDILTQLASGVNYIHSLGILHRDLKTANILLKNDGTIKITDFGVCEFVKNKPPGFKCLSVGTPIYMSPQAHKKFQYSSKSDAWAIGIIFYQMLLGRIPFAGLQYNNAINKIKDGSMFNNLKCSSFSKNIIINLLNPDVNLRWDTVRLLTQLSKCDLRSCFNSRHSMNSNFSKQIGPGCWF